MNMLIGLEFVALLLMNLITALSVLDTSCSVLDTSCSVLDTSCSVLETRALVRLTAVKSTLISWALVICIE